MNDELNKDQNNSTKPNDVQAIICSKCMKNPCVCPSNDNDSSQTTPEQKTRIKGSHRTGKQPKLKWI